MKKYNNEKKRNYISKADAMEKERSTYEKITDLLIDKIKNSRGKWEQPWVNVNLVPCSMPFHSPSRPYHGMNQIMLMFYLEKKGYHMPYFTTSNKLNSMNFMQDKDGNPIRAKDKEGNNLPTVHILKGEKGFPVILWNTLYKNNETGETIPYREFKKLSAEEQEKYERLSLKKTYIVFNIEQTNLKEARPQYWSKLEETMSVTNEKALDFKIPAVDKMIKDNLWICPVEVKPSNRAYYSLTEDKITVPEQMQYREGEEFYSTLFHEMAHSTGAESRLNRPTFKEWGDDIYSREELIAELSAVLACTTQGVSKTMQSSSEYLGSWLKCFEKEPTYIKSLYYDVKAASNMITDNIKHSEALLLSEGRNDSETFYRLISESVDVPLDGEMENCISERKFDKLLSLMSSSVNDETLDLSRTYKMLQRNNNDIVLAEDAQHVVVFNEEEDNVRLLRKYTKEEVVAAIGSGEQNEVDYTDEIRDFKEKLKNDARETDQSADLDEDGEDVNLQNNIVPDKNQGDDEKSDKKENHTKVQPAHRSR